MHNTGKEGIVKQSNDVRVHSLNFTDTYYGICKVWITLLLRGKVIRNNVNSNIIRSLDSTKLQSYNFSYRLWSNTTLITYQSYKGGSLFLRCYSTSSFDSIKRLEKSKRDLEAILTPKLKQNVIDYKNNPKTVWLLDNHNIDRSIIKLGIKTYISICTFLIAIKTSMTFTRYFNLEFNQLDITKLDKKVKLNNPEIYSQLKIIEKEVRKLENHYIVSKKAEIYKRRNLFSNVYREKIGNPEEWKEILEDSRINLESIIFKYWAVELLQVTHGAKTPGTDGIAYKPNYRLFEDNETKEAKETLTNLYKRYAKIISLSKGKNDQSINRKGLLALNNQEKLRRYLKSIQGKDYITQIRTELKTIKESPVDYANKIYWMSLEYNNKLKFDLCSYIKNSKLKSYKAKTVLRVNIPKPNGKFRPLGIPTIFDRCLQLLLKLVMEPYMEPLGDEMSLGFRPGRNCHQATAYIHQRLQYSKSNKPLSLRNRAFLDKRMESIYMKSKNLTGSITLDKIDPKNNVKVTIPGFGDKIVRRRQILVPSWLLEQAINKSDKILYDTQYIIDADIKSCFDEISHEWLIKNVPMPTNYEYLLSRILKTTIVELDKDNNPYSDYTLNKEKRYNIIIHKSENKKGIPQGGIISPLLMNWTLDGLQHVVQISAHNFGSLFKLYSIDRVAYLKRKDLEVTGTLNSYSSYKNRSRIEWYNTTWFVRYADDFLIGVKSEYMATLLKDEITKFLSDRGLIFSDEKTRIIPWKMGNHVDFLGWTHSLIKPKKVNWMISTSKHKAGKLIDWIGTYTYPSRKSTKAFRKEIKNLTTNASNYLTLDQVFKSINTVIRGWSNYFSPAPHQIHLRRHLDTYVWRRVRKFFMNKYQHSFHDIFIQHFTREVENWTNKAFYHKKSNTYRIWLQSPTISNTNIDKGNLRSSSINILSLTKLNMPNMWTFMVPTHKLLHNTPLADGSAFVKRALLIAKYRKDAHSYLLFKQKHKCAICNENLVNYNGLLGIDYNKIDNYINNSLYDQNLIRTNNENEDKENNKKVKYKNKNIYKNENILQSIDLPISKDIYWLPDVEIDHIIPKIIGGTSIELKKILNRQMNLQLIHKSCHKDKSQIDKLFIDEYRKIRKKVLPNNLNTYKDKELNTASYEIVIKMDKQKLFKKLNKQIVTQLVKVSRAKVKKSES